jgi:hypothetical protein
LLPVVGLALAALPAFVTPVPPRTMVVATPTIDLTRAERAAVPA